jgi:hypothetical protein
MICLLTYVPNPPCQLSLWEETGVPGKNPRLSAERWLFTLFTWGLGSSHIEKFSLRLEPATLEVKGKCANHFATLSFGQKVECWWQWQYTTLARAWPPTHIDSYALSLTLNYSWIKFCFARLTSNIQWTLINSQGSFLLIASLLRMLTYI